MRLKKLFEKFSNAVQTLYGEIKRTGAARARLEESLDFRPGTFDGAVAAAIRRDLSKTERAARRKNTRGLPKGYSAHQAKAARCLSRSKKHRGRATESQLHAAQNYLDDAKRCEQLRRRTARPNWIGSGVLTGPVSRSFLSKACPRAGSQTLAQFAARVSRRVALARESGRTPYRRPAAARA